MTLPTHTQVPYDPPSLSILLSLSLYLSLISFSSSFAARTIHAPLVGPLHIGILFGPVLAGLVPTSTQQVFIDIGYIALLLMVYEAGLCTDLQLLFRNLPLSILAALTGILLPFALSFALLTSPAYRYTTMQAFAAGASLSSTSLGTTLALLTPDLRKTRTGCVLMCAALADDIVGLVIAGIITGLADSTSSGGKVHWATIVRTILVSVAFAVGIPMFAWMFRKMLKNHWIRIGRSWVPQFTVSLTDPNIQLIITLLTLAAFVTATKYAETSELFGAYLAGVSVGWVFGLDDGIGAREPDQAEKEIAHRGTGLEDNETVSPNSDMRDPINSTLLSPPQVAFAIYIEPLLTPLLGPIFFASIGAALPVGALFTTHRTIVQGDTTISVTSHAVVWRGIVYSVLMILAKFAVGGWMLLWPSVEVRNPTTSSRIFPSWKFVGGRRSRYRAEDRNVRDEEDGTRSSNVAKETIVQEDNCLDAETVIDTKVSVGDLSNTPPIPPQSNDQNQTKDERPSDSNPLSSTNDLPPARSAALLGLAMVARGEIALIVAQLARGLLVSGVDEEPFAVVIWGILISTLGGALGVGMLLRSWAKI